MSSAVVTGPSERVAYMTLVRLLVEAVIADHGRDDSRIAVVDGARPNEEIAAVAETLSHSI